MMAATDIELHERWLRERDADAFAALVRAHSAMVYATCRRILRNAAEAEEVAQECFWKFAQSQEPMRSSAAAWLHTVATRQAVNRLKSEQRRRARETNYAAQCPELESGEWKEVRPHVDEALEALPESLREPILMHYFEGETHAALAEREGVAQSTITRRIQQGLDRVRRELRRKGVAVSVAGLTEGLAVEAASTVPAGLRASLMKIAFAGAKASTRATTGAASRTSALTWVLRAGAAAATIAVGAALFLAGETNQPPANESPRPVAAEESQTNENDTKADVADGTRPASRLDSNDVPATTVTEQAASPATLAAGELFPDDPEPAGTNPESQSVAIEGTVIDTSGYPIEGAQVWAVEHATWWYEATRPAFGATTDQSGAYRIEKAACCNSLVVSVTAPGQDDAFQIVSPDKPGKVLQVDFTLEPGVTLHGRVLDASGTAVSGAIVRVEGYMFMAGFLEDDGVRPGTRTSSGSGGRQGFAVTGEDGRFVMGTPLGGLVTLKVAAGSHGQSIFHQVPVGTGEEQVLVLLQTSTLFGTVRDAAGEPAVGVRVRAAGWFHIDWDDGEGRNGAVSAQTYVGIGDTDADGHYRITGLPGGLEYRARVVEPSVEPSFSHARTLTPEENLGVIEPGSERRWDDRIERFMQVTGRVVGTPSGAPIERRFNIKYLRDGNRVDVTMSDDSGAFSFQVFEPGPYLVYAGLDWFPEDVQFAYGREVRFQPGETAEVALTLPDPFSIAVDVVELSGKPVAGAEVGVTWGMEKRQSTFHLGRTDANGHFAFSSCFPGMEHWLHIAAPGFVPAVSTPIAGESGDTFPAERLVLHRAGGIEGTLIDRDGRPIVNAPINVTVLDGGGRSTSRNQIPPRVSVETHTDDRGGFAVADAIPEGPVVLEIQGESGTLELGPVEIQPDVILDVGALRF